MRPILPANKYKGVGQDSNYYNDRGLWMDQNKNTLSVKAIPDLKKRGLLQIIFSYLKLKINKLMRRMNSIAKYNC